MKFRASGCHCSNDQFRNRGINMPDSFSDSRSRETTTFNSGAIMRRLVPTSAVRPLTGTCASTHDIFDR